MGSIIGVRFKKPGKIYFFNPKGFQIRKGQFVIVETSMGKEFGEVVIPNRYMPHDKLQTAAKKIIRIANSRDIQQNKENKRKEEEAFKVCEKKIKDHGLNMKLMEVEYKFDRSKLLFFFKAEGRVDFRDLVKELAGIFRTRIELRQMGIRDEIRRIGGNGICGREMCCCSFLPSFESVSIKMAKEQNLSLNPSKISGNCGRLMCCLKYEQGVYQEKIKRLPKIGSIVKTEDGEGVVQAVETLKERVKVRLEDGDGALFKKYDAKDIKIIKNAQGNDDKIEAANPEDLKALQKLEQLTKEDSKKEE